MEQKTQVPVLRQKTPVSGAKGFGIIVGIMFVIILALIGLAFLFSPIL